eukprot:433327-Rhodomonas_salina.1
MSRYLEQQYLSSQERLLQVQQRRVLDCLANSNAIPYFCGTKCAVNAGRGLCLIIIKFGRTSSRDPRPRPSACGGTHSLSPPAHERGSGK